VGYAIAFVCAVLLVNAIAGERGYLELRRLQRHHAEATAALARRRAETAELKARIERLRTDPSAIEYAIREQLGYARPGEMVFPVREGSVSPGQAPTPVPNPPATAGRGH
jgi:cell division protein FtsB